MLKKRLSSSFVQTSNSWIALHKHEINIIISFSSTVCTPFGFVKLFGVVGQVLVKPHLLRDVDEEFQTFNLEEAFIRRKIENSSNCVAGKQFDSNLNENRLSVRWFFMSLDNSHGSLYDSAKLYTSGLDDLYKKKTGNGNSVDVSHLHERLRELESERKELGLHLHVLSYEISFL